jgi:hypothetical protein
MVNRPGMTFDVYDTATEMDPSEPIGQLALSLDPLVFWVFTTSGYVAVASATGTAPPSVASEAGQGVVELASQAEVEAGAAGVLVATVARLKAELDRRINPLTAAPTWVSATLTSGWTNTAGYQVAQYAKDSLGFVVLRGNVTGGSTGSTATILTLPVGFRPAATDRFTTASGTGTATIDVQADGRVVPTAVTNTANVGLSGIRLWPS